MFLKQFIGRCCWKLFIHAIRIVYADKCVTGGRFIRNYLPRLILQLADIRENLLGALHVSHKWHVKCFMYHLSWCWIQRANFLMCSTIHAMQFLSTFLFRLLTICEAGWLVRWIVYEQISCVIFCATCESLLTARPSFSIYCIILSTDYYRNALCMHVPLSYWQQVTFD